MRLKEHVKLSIKLMEIHSESTKQKRVSLRTAIDEAMAVDDLGRGK